MGFLVLEPVQNILLSVYVVIEQKRYGIQMESGIFN